MMINPRKAFESDEKSLNVLPRGASIPLDISFHDHTGQAFDVTDKSVNLRPSRFDAMVITNGKASEFNLRFKDS